MRRTRYIISISALVALLGLTGVALAATVIGTPGDEVLFGTSDDDNIRALSGEDTVYGFAGSDRIDAGSGDDIVFGDRLCPAASETYYYCLPKPGDEPGDDRIRGGPGLDEIRGNGGDDRISGGGGDDDVRGNGGDDRITPGMGEDFVAGGGGDDTIIVDDETPDRIGCGGGDDRVLADRGDDVGTNCEVVRRG